MALVRITHADGTIETISTHVAIEEINVQPGDKVEILDETLPLAAVESRASTCFDLGGASELFDVVQVTNGNNFLIGDTAGDGVHPVEMVGVRGDHGTLFMFSSGLYEYDLNHKDPKVQALGDFEILSDVFSYAIADGNGFFDTATLSICIYGGSNGPEVCDDDHAVDVTMRGDATDAADGSLHLTK
jgi:VCBS repeat-containing protein